MSEQKTPLKAEIDRNTEIIKASNLKKYYNTGQKKVLHALDDVSITIRKGEIFGVVGESGCGKSTLGRCLLKLVDTTEGSVVFDGQDITQFSRRQMKPLRREMQMIFQNPYSSFNPKKRIGQSLTEVGRVHQMTKEEVERKIRELLEYIRLPEDVLNRMPGELSGGQLQRLAVARALLLNPKFIVADEPVSALDVSVQAQILNLIMDLRSSFQMTMMFISHEMTVVEHLCDTVAVMYLGQVMEIAPTEELFSNLLHPYTQALMSAIPKANPEASSQRIVLKGDIPNAIDIPEGCRFASRCVHCQDICRQQAPKLRPVNGRGHQVACHLVKGEI